MATVTTHLTLSCRKREMPSFAGVAGANANSNKKRKLTEPAPAEQLNNNNNPRLLVAKTTPWADLPRQATCLILFFFVVAKMASTRPIPTSSPHSQQITKPPIRSKLGYVEITKALANLDILNSGVREILTQIDGLIKTAEEIDWLLKGGPGLACSVVRTKEVGQMVIDSIQDRLAFLDQQET
ncbi:hypothetical protein FGSG_07680 [Fusarium graminearum PH-1]|uniref:Chromosome 4, complete genome n=2 Tax=Gibberella zeae TaxID=5518 RepID=I1RU08_GIBZE|nr:hypothetical protein FGSG_07680 [Fusarium graminearum PH-1]EYB30257.1 hypothetical protein FG05_07680 [Fusarium graminearum]ESU13968.1 hypothetical protein FGSG_07680 [Fusarium graminearum PH-1]CAF3527592.1 unnamed protein product [Fusarium graminearum]CAG1970449.1 unnamed protein product [Fusarium graminearum]CAG1982459.1 unnamed protein product [Fusarium graminearum]|eukprot:XP_011327475.1 hypothetical protein FGSG_07680 [Fusarium graminearum PH-1]